MKFNFQYTDGSEETIDMSDCQTVDEAVDTHFGSNTVSLAAVAVVPDQAPAP